jgi:hypothetical protein
MSELVTQIIIALIGAVPPTIMAAAAYRRAKRLEKPITEVNSAVNHRVPGQKKLIEVIDEVSDTLENLNYSINRIENDLTQHRAWHFEQEEINNNEEIEDDDSEN